jgi:hypothetical protein
VTTINQLIEVYSGEDSLPTVTVKDASGVAINLSTASAIQWNVYDPSGTIVAVLSKSLGSGVTLIGGGTGGQFSVALTAANTTAIDGWYSHSAIVTDSGGLISVVETGRLLAKSRARGE